MWDCAARAKCFDTIGLAGLNISLADTPSTLVSRLPMATSQLQHPGDGSESYVEGCLVPAPATLPRLTAQARLWASQEPAIDFMIRPVVLYLPMDARCSM